MPKDLCQEPPRRVAAAADPSLSAVVLGATPLRYSDGADARLDRPAHVRAGSALGSVGGRLAVIQDDANFVALLDPERRDVMAISLPAGHEGLRQFDEGRGNKRWKLDLEACAAGPDGAGELLLAFGSGSSPERERVAALRWPGPQASLHRLPRLYALLRATAGFSGSELNLEGAVYLGDDRLLLLQRGNGAPRDGREPLDATCELSWSSLLAHLRDPQVTPPPAPTGVVQYQLGVLGGVRLGFTDAALCPGGILFLAVAEASPDAVRDGPVAGVALGILGGDGPARWTALQDREGRLFLGKAEGLSWQPEPAGRVLVVLDRDDPRLPSELCEVELGGAWW